MIGPDRFEVLTVGFDARNDTPARLAQFASMQGIKSPNWRLASADAGDHRGAAARSRLQLCAPSPAASTTSPRPRSSIATAGSIATSMATNFRCRCSWSRSRTSSTARRRSFTFSGIIDRIKFICTDLRSRRRALPHRLWAGVRQRDRGVLAAGVGRPHSARMASRGATHERPGPD